MAFSAGLSGQVQSLPWRRYTHRNRSLTLPLETVSLADAVQSKQREGHDNEDVQGVEHDEDAGALHAGVQAAEPVKGYGFQGQVQLLQ
jgi:hypothetical protein